MAALLLALLQAAGGLWGAHRDKPVLMRAAGSAAVLQAFFVASAFGLLVSAFLRSDFSLLNVWQNSHTAKPVLYKFAGAWGSHEGSLLLWLLMLSGLGAAVALAGRLPDALRARVVGVQGLVGVGFLAFTVLTSNPFRGVGPIVPTEGQDLNPLLQDPGLAFHPPFLYLGYVGMSVAFGFAVAALLEGRMDASWARWVRPWTLLAWSSLTLGIAMGAWWAYYELGWGGFWFWDPVENASLMPWLAATALLHCALVVEKRDALKAWTVFMAIMAFATSLLGTFLVRSGIVTSVHAFANDPNRGAVLLVLCGLYTGGAFLLFALRGGRLTSTGVFAGLSRESALVVNNILLSVLLFTVLLGTFWPTVIEVATGERITVGPPYFNAVGLPLLALIALALAAGTFLPWKRGRSGDLVRKARTPALAAMIAAAVWYGIEGGSLAALCALVVGLWILLFAVFDLARRVRTGEVPARESLRRLRGLPRGYWGGTLAHAGLGVAVLGMVGTAIWAEETRAVLAPGQSAEVAGYTLTLDRIYEAKGPNYLSEVSAFTLSKKGRTLRELYPERRWYPGAQQMTTEVAVGARGFSDVYLAVGEGRGENREARVVRAYHHPLVYLLWGGAVLMAAGGALSLSDPRYRAARVAVRRRPSAPALAPAE
ncbi:cytochrome c-type biogenesis protein CcmF [Parvularcula dongshanensis]|uniref:Cytochrome c-type biogenesis protein CcmF n=1 Tax=Parvularcula dongshanensis TaxID=1173995 RepID=A0A840I2W7_9PROT|nr:cytochrome c-type biogenesis protein CcmF [Parvularcula dongshanensis]